MPSTSWKDYDFSGLENQVTVLEEKIKDKTKGIRDLMLEM